MAVDSAGNVYVADQGNHTIRKVTAAGTVTTLAGLAGHAGTNDAIGDVARFNSPSDVAVDIAGNVFVADCSNHTIRKVTPTGVVTTLAGSAVGPGSADGTGSVARLNWPNGVAVDSVGNVFVTDNVKIRKVTPAGVVTSIGGQSGFSGSADGIGSLGGFNQPGGVAVDSEGNLYVADSSNNRISKGTPVSSTFPARPGSPREYPYTAFDREESPPKRIGLPEYHVNTASLNLVLESTLFYMPTLGVPVNLRLVYNSAPTPNGAATIGLFGKNWRFRYEAAIVQSGNNVLVTTSGGRPWLYTTPNGQELAAATPASPITLAPPAGMFDELKFYGAGQYFELREKASRVTQRYGVSGGISNALWRLTRLTDRSGNQINLAVDGPTGRIGSITDPAHRVVTLTYNSAQNLCTGITTPDGRHLAFTYDANKNLIGITDMAGYTASYAYCAMGFLRQMSTAGRKNTFTYYERPGDSSGDMIVSSISNAKGQVTRYAVLAGNVGVRRTDPKGGVTVFNSAGSGQTAKVADPLGNIRQMSYNAAQLPAAFTDSDGQLTTFAYDARGNLTLTKDALGNQTTMGYDARDNLVSRANALSQTWTYAYDANDRVTSVQTPLRNTTQFTYFATGRLQTHRDARNNATAFQYDGYGNLTQTTDPLAKSTQVAYDTNGLHCTSMTDARGKIKSMEYDKNDRLTTVSYSSVAGIPKRVNAFDAFGQTSLTDELGKLTEVTRNEFGYITSVTDPLGNVTATDYDANHNPISVTDALGRLTSTTYDAANRPLVLTDPRGNKVTRAYDATGNLLSLTDKQNNKTAFTYDANNRLTQTKDPLQKTVTLSHDVLGRVATAANARGQTIRYTYDADGRIIKKEYQEPGGTEFVQAAAFTYDANGNVLTRADAWGTTTFTYDPRNQPTAITYPTSKTASFTYTDAGQLATLTYPNGMVVSYTYDDYNRLVIPASFRNGAGTELQGNGERPNQVTRLVLALSGTTNTIDFAYDEAGNMVSSTRPNGTSTTYEYDNAQRVTNVLHQSGASTLLQCQLAYNAIDNVVQESVAGSAVIAPGLPVAATAVYDACNQISNRAVRAYTYDADGNLTNIAGGEFAATYTPENRPRQITRKRDAVTETLQYTYDADGLRVKRTVVGGVTTQFHYGPDDQLLFTTDGAGNVTASYVWNGPVQAAVLTGGSLGTGLRYPHLNRLGSVLALTDAAGAPTVKYAYQPYGGVTRETVPAGGTDANLFTFVGGLGVQDEGGGLFYMKNRFYDSVTGRFLQRDPIGFEGGFNLYAYVGNDPIDRTDPTGLLNFDGEHVDRFLANAPRSEAIANMAIKVGDKVVEERLTAKGKIVYKALRGKSPKAIAVSVFIKSPAKALVMGALGFTSAGASVVVGLAIDVVVDAAEPVVTDAVKKLPEVAEDSLGTAEMILSNRLGLMTLYQ